MDEIRTDRRVIVAQRAPELRERLEAGREGYLDAKFALARVFAEVDRKKAFVFESVTSIGAYAADLGYDPEEATQLCWLGQAFEKCPTLEADIREKRVTLSRVARWLELRLA